MIFLTLIIVPGSVRFVTSVQNLENALECTLYYYRKHAISDRTMHACGAQSVGYILHSASEGA